MELLQAKGAEISYNDPHIPALRPTRKYAYTLTSTPLTEENLAQADCLLLATDHDAYDRNFILQHARLIVDTRDFFSADTLEAASKIYKA